MDENVKLTPMIKQYLDIKARYEDYILMYRLGDFYEMFFDDAQNVSKELELTLTARAGTPMCGVPFHASETYIKRLVEKGYKIAICEQIENPNNTSGLFEREVVRIVTAGTMIEDSMLSDSSNNFIGCFYAQENRCGIVFADLSTGELHVAQKEGELVEDWLKSEISRYQPVEVLFNESFVSFKSTAAFLKTRFEKCVGEMLGEDQFRQSSTIMDSMKLFSGGVNQLDLLGFDLAKKALFGVLGYFAETQKNAVSRFTKLKIHEDDEYMSLGLMTRRNLELTETMRNREYRGSLLWVLDKTNTSMGKRMLRQFIERPLINQLEIIKRLDTVECLVGNSVLLDELCNELGGVYDLERLMTRIVYKAASPQDVFSLGTTLSKVPKIKSMIEGLDTRLLKEINSGLFELPEVTELISRAIFPEPPSLMKDGNYIKDGFNEELDHLRNITKNNKSYLAEIEEREREATGIKNLKVGQNRVFGYYIEVSKGNAANVPDSYIRKQTIANGERFITEELKNIENTIMSAASKSIALEAEIFAEVREFISANLKEIQETAESIAMLDVFCSFAKVAIQNDYHRPDITFESVIQIKDGRHPVIELMLKDSVFTPNDTFLGNSKNRLIIITGPNMAGKSTYMRQVAVITLMAQIGCFVPASSARIGVVDKIFTRVGASDDLTSGQSTFMVEMTEVAEILESATSRSLVILDEIGRGTSTFDGISIAKAVAEYINGKAIGCKTLFATHYHELIALEKTNPGIRNFSVSAVKKGDSIHFLHKIVEGGVDDSYGVEVAKLAGLPQKVINNAKSSLMSMERNSKIELEQQLKSVEEGEAQINFTALSRESVINKLKAVDINQLTPIEALQLLAELKEGIS